MDKLFDWKKYSLSVKDEQNLCVMDLDAEISPVPFYKVVKVVKILNRHQPVFFLFFNDRYQELDGRPHVIFDANQYEELQVEEATAVPYVMFFNQFMVAEFGHFCILDGAQDPQINDIRGEVAPELLAKIAPITYLGAQNNCHYVNATVRYGKSIALVTFEVQGHGAIQMSEAIPLWPEEKEVTEG